MLTQSCSATADGAALYQAKCFSCHDTLATTPLKAKHPTMTTYTAAHDMQTLRTDDDSAPGDLHRHRVLRRREVKHSGKPGNPRPPAPRQADVCSA